MPRLLGKPVKIIRVDTDEVYLIHIRKDHHERHPDADYTTDDRKRIGSKVDHIKISKKEAKRRRGWLGGLFSRDSDDDKKEGGGGWGLDIGW